MGLKTSAETRTLVGPRVGAPQASSGVPQAPPSLRHPLQPHGWPLSGGHTPNVRQGSPTGSACWDTGSPRRQFSQDSEVETSAAPGRHVPEDRRHPCRWRPTGPGAPSSPSPAGGGPEWLQRRAHSPQPWVHKHGAPPSGRDHGMVQAPRGAESRALGPALPQPPPRAPARLLAPRPGTWAPALGPSPGAARGDFSSDASALSGPGGPPPGSWGPTMPSTAVSCDPRCPRSPPPLGAGGEQAPLQGTQMTGGQ